MVLSLAATIPAATPAQRVLQVLFVLLVAIGGGMLASGLGLLKSRRKPRPARPSRARVALGAVMVVGGVILWQSPIWPVAEPDVISDQRFSSSRLPAVAVNAPAGWRLEHDPGQGRLTAKRQGSRLMIETARVADVEDAAALLAALTDEQQRHGLSLSTPPPRSIDGLNAAASVALADPGSVATWVVQRTGRLFTIVICTSDTGPDAGSVCEPVLSTLTWRAPGPL